MKVEAEVSISRVQTTSDGSHIQITVEDSDAGIHLCRVSMSLEDFAKCVTGLGGVSGEAEFGDLSLAGKIRQQKSMFFPKGYEDNKTDEEILETLSVHEVDGWKAIPSSYKKSPKRVGHELGVLVLYRRWIDRT